MSNHSGPIDPARRHLLQAGVALGACTMLPMTHAMSTSTSPLCLIEAPSNLGLRPPRPGVEPGTWRAPAVLVEMGLAGRLRPRVTHRIPRPHYAPGLPAVGTIRNGPGIREFAEALAVQVRAAHALGLFPLVVGGDCSILLGSLLGARAQGRCGLIHLDGHGDFFTPDPAVHAPPFSAAGMDLALATGRGEALLARWEVPGGRLVEDADVLQAGEREELDPDYAYPDIARTAITRVPVRQVLRGGIDAFVRQAAEWARARDLRAVWLHVDCDVLDQQQLPAVDSPGSPGLTYRGLSRIVDGLLRALPVCGMDLCIYDPDLDPARTHAARLVECVAAGLSSLTTIVPEETRMDGAPQDSAAMLAALAAAGPAAAHAEELMQFGQFVGSWSLEVIYYHPDGSIKRRTPGEWHFGWALEGRAIQDVWMVPPRSQRTAGAPPPGEYGTTLRFYDPALGAWRSTWHGPVHNIAWPFIGRRIGEEIVLERTDGGEITRWIFARIERDAFHWRAVSSTDDGRTWRLDQEMFATRTA